MRVSKLVSARSGMDIGLDWFAWERGSSLPAHDPKLTNGSSGNGGVLAH